LVNPCFFIPLELFNKNPNIIIFPEELKAQNITKLELELLDFPKKEIQRVINSESFNPI